MGHYVLMGNDEKCIIFFDTTAEISLAKLKHSNSMLTQRPEQE